MEVIQSDFPFCFSSEGHLLHRETQEPFKFKFNLLDVHATDQEHQAICSFLTQHVYSILENRFCLMRMPLKDASFVFLTPGALEHCGKLLVLIQDEGSIRSGVWSWSVTAELGLDRGSQIPYLESALSQSYAVIIMNPNESQWSQGEHVRLVWEELVLKSAAEHVFVVVHGRGGLAFVDLVCGYPEEMERKVKAVALLASSHSLWHQPLSPSGRKWLQLHSRSWILSSKPLSRSVGYLKAGCSQVSAGTQRIQEAPNQSMEAVFRFFTRSLKVNAIPFEMVTRSRTRDPNNNTKAEQ